MGDGDACAAVVRETVRRRGPRQPHIAGGVERSRRELHADDRPRLGVIDRKRRGPRTGGSIGGRRNPDAVRRHKREGGGRLHAASTERPVPGAPDRIEPPGPVVREQRRRATRISALKVRPRGRAGQRDRDRCAEARPTVGRGGDVHVVRRIAAEPVVEQQVDETVRAGSKPWPVLVGELFKARRLIPGAPAVVGVVDDQAQRSAVLLEDDYPSGTRYDDVDVRTRNASADHLTGRRRPDVAARRAAVDAQ